MLITPLQYLLKENSIAVAIIVEKTGFHRTTLWRWKKGLHHPEKPEAEKLISLYKEVEFEINGNPYTLDFNGCYDKTLEVANDYL